MPLHRFLLDVRRRSGRVSKIRSNKATTMACIPTSSIETNGIAGARRGGP